MVMSMLPCAASGSPPLQTEEFRGRVTLPDGSGAAGATVTSVTDCGRINLRAEATADSSGFFTLAATRFPDCGRTQFFAEDAANFWLKTGDGCFYPKTNGRTPSLDPAVYDAIALVEIPLELRGGKVVLQVRDKSTGSAIHAGLWLRAHQEHELPKYCSISDATGKDGAPLTKLLPTGKYVVSIDRVGCGTKTHFTAEPPSYSFEIREGAVTTEIMEIDVAKLEMKSSYDNPHGVRCEHP
jgi:hypothetical protein